MGWDDSGSAEGQVTGPCKQSSEPSGSKKGGKFLD
jgi:hypothetical protein